MKPTKNKVFCKNCDRTKILFETEKKAENFIKFNKEEIEAEAGYSPQRSYYCLFCGGWHTTSLKENRGASKKEKMFEQLMQVKHVTACKKNSADHYQEKRNEIMKELESQIKEMDTLQKENFFSENINILKQKIALVSNSINITDTEKLKELRLNLEMLYIVRKQNGFQKKINNVFEKLVEKEFEEYRLWIEKNGTN
jgi:hypothetical protein